MTNNAGLDLKEVVKIFERERDFLRGAGWVVCDDETSQRW